MFSMVAATLTAGQANRMAYTRFTLRRLFISVTIVSVFLGLAVVFPSVARKVASVLLLFAPTAVVFVIAFQVLGKTRRTFVIVVVAAFVGWVTASRAHPARGLLTTFLGSGMAELLSVGLSMASPVLVLVFLEWLANVTATRRPGRNYRR